jgi:hypothetical protein
LARKQGSQKNQRYKDAIAYGLQAYFDVCGRHIAPKIIAAMADGFVDPETKLDTKCLVPLLAQFQLMHLPDNPKDANRYTQTRLTGSAQNLKKHGFSRSDGTHLIETGKLIVLLVGATHRMISENAAGMLFRDYKWPTYILISP